MRKKLILFTSIIAVLMIVQVLTGCWTEQPEKAKQIDTTIEGNIGDHGDDHTEEEGHLEITAEALNTLNIKTEPVELRDTEVEITTTAVIEHDQTRMAHVGPRIPGRAIEVKAFIGDRVKKGQVLAELDSIELGEVKSDYLKASANLQVAQANYQREERLYKRQISSEKEYLNAKGEFLRSQAQKNSTQEKLRLLGLTDKEINNIKWGSVNHSPSHFSLRAPFDGTITEQHIVQGELLKPEDKPYIIADLSLLWIQLDIYEKDLRWVKKDTEVRIKTDAYPEESFVGNVTYISDLLSESTRTAKARVEIPNSDRKLKPGMFATAIITVHSSDERKVISIPRSAVYKIDGKPIAFVQEGDRKFEMRELKIVKSSSSYIEILEGLNIGEKVVTEGGFHLKSVFLKKELGGGHSH